MALVVQKYGGTSVGTTDRIKNVAKRIIKTYEAGNEVVVVVSAMSGETNKLVALANEMMDIPDNREYDVVVATGEQVTIGLLSMYLKSLGYKAKSYMAGRYRSLPTAPLPRPGLKALMTPRCAPT